MPEAVGSLRGSPPPLSAAPITGGVRFFKRHAFPMT